MRLIATIIALAASATAALACGNGYVTYGQTYAQKVYVKQAVVAYPVQLVYPVYSAVYAPDTGELKKELASLRADLKQALAARAEKVEVGAVLGKCAACHQADVAEKKGGAFVVAEKDGKVPAFSLAEKRLIKRVVEKGDMPPKGSEPLSDAEKKALVEFLNQ